MFPTPAKLQPLARKLNIQRSVTVLPMLDAEDWQLYPATRDCEAAAHALNSVLDKKTRSL